MDINVLLGLYKILAENPDAFHDVLRNLYSREIQIIKNMIEEGIEDIDIESGERADRDHYFKEKVEDQMANFDSLILVATCFRKVDMHGHIGADDLISALQEMKDEIRELAEKTGKEVQRIRKGAKAAGVGNFSVRNRVALNGAEEEVLAEFKRLKDDIFSQLRGFEDELDDINNTRL